MSKHLHRELDSLKRNLLAIGAMVEEAIQKAMVSFYDQRTDLAEQVIEEDDRIDQKEVQVEEECLKLLALHQPVAEDLRFITSVMKINNDLERMGDGAASIAKRSLHIAKSVSPRIPTDLKKMTDLTTTMVHDCLEVFVKRDPKLARSLCIQDDKVDVFQRNLIKEMRRQMKENVAMIDPALDVFTIIRRLERIADLATNIAEDVVYMVEGDIIRHRSEEVPRS